MSNFKFIITLFLVCSSSIKATKSAELSDNEFAEFEDFEEDNIDSATPVVAHFQEEESQEDVVIGDELEDEDSEFEHFHDGEEFEGFDKDDKPISEPKITITKVPIHFQANWDSYWLEILMVTGLIVYFINFVMGKSKNQRIANAWFQTHRGLLEDNFSLVGDDGSLEKPENSTQTFIKDSENVFTLWCSGRTCCEGMLVELKLIKRQDLVAILAAIMRPTIDQFSIKVTMNKEDMDTFVFCVASKKTAAHLSKEMADLSVFCPERRTGDKFGLPSQFSVLSEISEATSAMLDNKITAIFQKFPDFIDFIHFSDQYSGVKQTDEAVLKPPDNQKVLSFGFNIPLKKQSLEEAMVQLKPLLTMVFYCIEKVKRYKLSKEGKQKADKNRQKVEEAYLKSTHQARAEAAAARREEKRRLEKEKVMADEDPERQRRWEEREQKRQAKKRAPKMKQLKVKAL